MAKKLDQQLYFDSANSDTNPELLQTVKGEYLDSKNMRRSSAIGNKNAKEKIKGEQILYENYYLPAEYPSGTPTLLTDYNCLNYTFCKGYQIAVWANRIITNLPLITIDDRIVCQSDELGFLYEYPIQSDINESCVGGEVFFTDFHITPIYFNIQDLLDNFNNNTPVYFAAFNPSIYTITLEKQNDQPVLDGIITGFPIAGYSTGNGLDFGYYAYAIQYVDAAGNKAAVGTFTPMIPIIANYTDSLITTNVPNHLTRGSNNSFQKKYGIRLRYRITNTSNYDHVNIIRVKWNAESLTGTVPSAQSYTPNHLLVNEETSIQPFTDDTTVIWSDLAPADETQVLSVVQAAKGIRYYDNRVVLMNIKYASKDLTNTGIEVPIINNEKIFPYVHNMGIQGHATPRNTTYYRGHKAGEKSGFAILCKDFNGEDAFAFPIEDVNGEITYQFPNNREALSTNSKNASVIHGQGAVWSATINSHGNNPSEQNYTNEIINLQSRGVNVGKPQLPAYTPKEKGTLSSLISIIWEDVQNYNIFNPIHPVHQDDTNIQGHREIVTNAIYLNSQLDQWINYPSGHVFAPEFYAKGLGITGITGLPSWIKSFSIVKTAPVKRVIAQGIAMYAFTSLNNSDKQLNKIWFSSKDLEELNINILDATHLQFISPLGFHTEFYDAHKKNEIFGSENHGMDMMCYARIGYNSAASQHTNYLLQKSSGALNYYTEFGSWRNTQSEANNPFYDNSSSPFYIANPQVNGNKKFTISTSTPPVLVTHPNSRYSFWEITLNENIYQNPTAVAGGNVNDSLVQAYHEPFYLVNLINDYADLPQNNVTTYYKTGHHQKIDSIIGTGTSSSQIIQLCDERYDDCMPSEYAGDPDTGTDYRPLIDTFIYIKDKVDGTEKTWLNITHKTTAIKDQIIADLNSQGYYDIPIASYYPNPYGETQDMRIEGVYTSDWNMASDKDGKDAKIVLNNISDSSGNPLSADYCLPFGNKYIIVRYDNRFPLKVFGGDTIISENTDCFVDGKLDAGGDGGTSEGELYLETAFPYFGCKFYNSFYKRVKDAQNHHEFNIILVPPFYIPTGMIQQEQDYKINYVRQLCVNYFFETKIHMPYEYNDVTGSSGYYYHNSRSFPRTHYIMRPERWNDGGGNKAKNFSDSSGGGTGAIWQESGWASYDDSSIYPIENEGFGGGGGSSWPSGNWWGYGGFLCNNNNYLGMGAYNNIDYQKTNNYLPSISKPVVGFHEINEYCSRIIWSEQRNIAQQNVPNLKTFLGTSFFDIEDAYGEIKRVYNAETSKGDNLYAFTNNGIALLLTGKEMSQDAIGNAIAFVRTPDRFISGRIWLRTDVGMNDEMWRSAAEWAKTIFWANNESSFMMFDNQITDIGRMNYRKRLYYDGLQKVLPGYESSVCGVFNRHNNEYWLNLAQKPEGKSISLADLISGTQINYYVFSLVQFVGVSYLVTPGEWINITELDTLNHVCFLPQDFSAGDTLTITNSSLTTLQIWDPVASIPNSTVLLVTAAIGEIYTFTFDGVYWSITANPVNNETFVFFIDGKIQGWEGTYSFNYEKMICFNEKVFGIRQGIIYETGLGYQINGTTIESSLKSVANKEQPYDKESISILVNSPLSKPTRVDFANSISALPECSLYAGMSVPPNPRYLKEYGQGRFTNLLPRKTATGRPRLQGRILVFDIIHSEPEDFVVVDSVIEYKNLKLQM